MRRQRDGVSGGAMAVTGVAVSMYQKPRFVRHDSATVIATSSARSEADSEQLTEIIAALPLLATEYPVKNPGGGRYH